MKDKGCETFPPKAASSNDLIPRKDKESSMMALNTVARRMFLQRQHKDKKAVDENELEFY